MMSCNSVSIARITLSRGGKSLRIDRMNYRLIGAARQRGDQRRLQLILQKCYFINSY